MKITCNERIQTLDQIVETSTELNYSGGNDYRTETLTTELRRLWLQLVNLK